MNETLKMILCGVLIGTGTVLLLLCNSIWYRAVIIASEKEPKRNALFNHLEIYPKLKKAILEETDPIEKKRLESLVKQLKLLGAILPIAVICIIGGGILLGRA